MGKTILTANQCLVLEQAAKDKRITDWFYFTGGTALSEFYLQHRLSEDLDFFSVSPIHQQITDKFIEEAARKLSADFVKKSIMGHAVFTLNFKDTSTLKIDFVYQPFDQLELGKKYQNLTIASLWDIIVDKLYTIFLRATARDFIDLYFGIRKLDCNLSQLIKAMEEKYQTDFDRLSLLSRLPVVKDVVDYPKMLVPFNKEKMVEFYLKLMRNIEKEIFQ